MTRHDAAQHGNAEVTQETDAKKPGKNQSNEYPTEIHTKDGQLYTLSIPQVRRLLADAGHIVSARTLIRWCGKGLIDAALRPEENGQYEKYYVTESSVLKKIGQLDRVKPTATLPVSPLRQAETTPGHVETERVNLANHRDDDMPSDNMTRYDSRFKDSGKSESKVQCLRQQVQELKDQLRIKSVDIQIKEQLLIREREVVREVWDKIAELGEQVGKWKGKYEKLELASATESIIEGQTPEHPASKVGNFEPPHQTDAVEVAVETKNSVKTADAISRSNPYKRRDKKTGMYVRYALYSIIGTSAVLMALVLI